MRTLKKIQIQEMEASTQVLSRERMKAIKGGGGNCYVYCSGYNSSYLTIVQNCHQGPACFNGVRYCSCQ